MYLLFGKPGSVFYKIKKDQVITFTFIITNLLCVFKKCVDGIILSTIPIV